MYTMSTYSFRTFIQKDGDQYHGSVPALPGCHTFGSTVEETQKNLSEAIEGYVLSCLENKDPIPKDDGLQAVQTISIPDELSRQEVHA